MHTKSFFLCRISWTAWVTIALYCGHRMRSKFWFQDNLWRIQRKYLRLAKVFQHDDYSEYLRGSDGLRDSFAKAEVLSCGT